MAKKDGVGRYGERVALQHVRSRGWEVLDTNWRGKDGELDIVALDGETLVFAEVKTRRSGARDPWENLHDRKQSKVRRMAISWLAEGADRPYGAQLRFDGIAVLLDTRGDLVRLDHLEAAF